MKNLILVFFALLALTACNRQQPLVPEKNGPAYTGVDPEVEPIVNEFKRLAAKNGITFKKEVTVGLTDINSNSVVGICTYGKNFREIDLDKGYINNTSAMAKKTVIFHELTHCYCTRGHTYDHGKNYEFDLFAMIADLIPTRFYKRKPGPGFYQDWCPTSIMYPTVVSDWCVSHHHKEYAKEMFEDCDPI